MPAELHRVAPETNVLAQQQPAIYISESEAARLRPSLLLGPFEALRSLWDPNHNNNNNNNNNNSTPSKVLLAGATCCMQVSWNNKLTRRVGEYIGTEQGATTTTSGIRLRFVSNFPHRKYAVERSLKQLEILLLAFKESFPHLVVPASKEISIHVARTMLEFIEAHVESFSSYLPLLYFLYETDEKSVFNFFNSLEELLRRRQTNENNLLDALKPRESSWFRWSTPKPTPQEINLSEDVSFLDLYNDKLPSNLKVRILFSQSRIEALRRAKNATVNLRDALLEEVDAFESAVECCGKSQGKLLQYGCEGWETNQFLEKEEKEKKRQEERLEKLQEINEAKKIKESISEFMNVASVLRGQIFGPILTTLVDSVKMTEIVAESQCKYLKSMLDCSKAVINNEPFITGVKGPPKSSQAFHNPILLRQVTEYYGKLRHNFRAFKISLDDELRISDKMMRKNLLLCCTNCFQAFTTLYDSFEARHHTKLIRPGEYRDSSLHPLLQIFDNTKEKYKVKDFVMLKEEERSTEIDNNNNNNNNSNNNDNAENFLNLIDREKKELVSESFSQLKS